MRSSPDAPSRLSHIRPVHAPFRRLEPELALKRISAKEMLFLEGDPRRCAYQVVEGAIRLQRATRDGRRQVVGFAGPGDWIAEGAGDTYAHTAEALGDTLARTISAAELERRKRDDHRFLEQMLQVADDKLRRAEEQMLLLGQRGATEKVAAFLLSFAARLGRDGELRLPMDRTDIADFLGLTIETVSRQFTKLKTLGAIALPNPSLVRLLDMALLDRVANDSGLTH